ncbi:MAG: BatD family protein [Planctomycetota bacterium]|jgi:hypothetical protein
MTRTALITTVFLATLFAPARPARAAEVSASVSSREVFVDLPFTLQVAIENARDREEPQLPQLIGVNVLGDPSESSSSFTQIINGRMTQRETVTLSYRLVATRAGPFTIGPITVVADGATFRTVPIKMVATTSETGDLLFLGVRLRTTSAPSGSARHCGPMPTASTGSTTCTCCAPGSRPSRRGC